MKILHVINALSIGGAETMLLEIVTLLNQKKDIVADILILKDEDPSMVETFREQNINVYILNKKSQYSPSILWDLLQKTKEYNIIHAHLFPTNYWIAMIGMLSDKKIIFTEHNTNNKRRQYKLFKYLDHFIYSKYHHIISISQSVQENLLTWIQCKNSKKFSIIENGINLEKFRYAISHKKEEFFDTNSTILMMVGKFSTQKDQDTIIKSLKYLPNTIKLLLIGDGIRKDILTKLVSDLNLDTRVKFLGNRNDIPSLTKMADIIIVSSHWEGFGLVAVEGMACKKSVLASNVEGLKQIVENYGLIFKKNDEKNLAEKIKFLYEDENYKYEIEDKCFSRAHDFSIETLVDKYILLYQKLLKEKS